MEKAPVFCWHCGKRFYIELKNYYAGQLFCSDKCRLENMKQDLSRKNTDVPGGKIAWNLYIG